MKRNFRLQHEKLLHRLYKNLRAVNKRVTESTDDEITKKAEKQRDKIINKIEMIDEDYNFVNKHY